MKVLIGTLRTQENEYEELLKSETNIKIENEDAISHMFIRKMKNFNP